MSTIKPPTNEDQPSASSRVTRAKNKVVESRSESDSESDSVYADTAALPTTISENAKRVPEDGLVSKCATTIHLSCEMKLSQRRALNLLVHIAMPNMCRQTLHQVSLNVLAWAMTGDSRASRNLRTLVPDIKAMMQIVSEWDVLNEDGGVVGWEGMTLVSWIKIDRDTGIVHYRFTEEFQERIIYARKAVEIALRLQLSFNSIYSMTLYEHARYYLDIGVTPWLSPMDFRTIMGLQNKESYSDFRRLTQRIINPAVKVINEVTDIDISAEVQRRDKGQVVAICFTVALKAVTGVSPTGESKPPQPDAIKPVYGSAVATKEAAALAANTQFNPPDSSDLRAPLGDLTVQLRLAEYAVPTGRAVELIRKHGPSAILAALAAADLWRANLVAQGGKVRSMAAVACKAIREQWGSAPIGDNSVIRHTPVTELRESAQQVTTSRQPRGVWCTRYLDGLSTVDRLTILENFKRYLADPQRRIICEAYRVHGLDSRVVIAELQTFLMTIGVSESTVAVQ